MNPANTMQARLGCANKRPAIHLVCVDVEQSDAVLVIKALDMAYEQSGRPQYCRSLGMGLAVRKFPAASTIMALVHKPEQ